MIISVTLNAAMDRTVAVPNFRQGHKHRSVESRTVPGGKGINVARALRLLGRPVIATGLAGGATGDGVLAQLTEESLLTDFIRIAEETRINLAVIDPTSNEQTEINERGPHVRPEELDAFVKRLDYLAGGGGLACPTCYSKWDNDDRIPCPDPVAFTLTDQAGRSLHVCASHAAHPSGGAFRKIRCS